MSTGDAALRRFSPAASGLPWRRRDVFRAPLDVLYLSVSLDLIFQLYFLRPQTWKP
jgi:hypothetical protein